MKLYLIRHGESYINLPDWQKGYIDVGLTELGHQQAHALAKWLPSHIHEFSNIIPYPLGVSYLVMLPNDMAILIV